MFCNKCGAEIKDGSKFCGKCGAKVEDMIHFTIPAEQADNLGLTNNAVEAPQANPTVSTMNNNQVYSNPVQAPAETVNEDPKAAKKRLKEEKKRAKEEAKLAKRNGKKKSNGLVITLIVLLVLALLGGGAFAGWYYFLKTTPVETKEFVKVEVDGNLEGYSSANVTVDYNKLTEIIGYKTLEKAFKENHTTKEIRELAKQYNFDVDDISGSENGKAFLNVGNFIETKITNNEQLANDTKVTVTFVPTELSKYKDIEELKKALRIELDNEYVYTVEGLEKPEMIDVMPQDIKDQVVFAGIEGKGSAIFGWKYNSYDLGNGYRVRVTGNEGSLSKNNISLGKIVFEIAGEDKNKTQGSLSQGDKITITAKADEKLVEKLIADKLIIKDNSVSLTVPELSKYVDISELSEDQIISLCEPVVIYARNSHRTNRTTNLYDLLYIVPENDDNPKLALVFKTTIGEYFYVCGDLYISEDGENASIGLTQTVESGKTTPVAEDIWPGCEITSVITSNIQNYKYAAEKFGTIVNGSLSIRTGPGVYYDKASVDGSTAFRNNEEVEILNEDRDVDTDLWYQVKFNRGGTEYTYWASGMYVQIDG